MSQRAWRRVEDNPDVQESADGRFRVVRGLVKGNYWYITFERIEGRWSVLTGRWPSAVEAARACDALREPAQPELAL